MIFHLLSLLLVSCVGFEALNRRRFFFSFFADHPWIQNAKKAPNVPLGDIVRSRLKQFSMMNRLKKKALRVSVASHFLKMSL